MDHSIPAAAWGWQAAEIEPLAGGLINLTFAVRRDGEPIAVLQRLHPIFAAEVNLDLEAVTAHLAAAGLETPRLLRTRDGAAWIENEGIWRALSWVDGQTVHAIPDPSWAAAGGALVGRFHRALEGLHHDYAFVRAGVHDTRAHLQRLAGHVAAASSSPGDEAAEAVALGQAIAGLAADLPPLLVTPRRHCHGDLKISNLRFDAGPPPAGRCLVDLDTLGRSTIAYELGDAMRSWCNPRGEDVAPAGVDLPIFTAAMTGYLAVAGSLLSVSERRSIVAGLETVAVELAARFCVDAFEDRYFGWDPSRFASRRQHNLVRAKGQLSLATSVRAQREALLEVLVRGT